MTVVQRLSGSVVRNRDPKGPKDPRALHFLGADIVVGGLG